MKEISHHPNSKVRLQSCVLLCIIFCTLTFSANAQRNLEWQVGYYAPFVNHMGGSVGCAVPLVTSEQDLELPKRSKHRLLLLTELNYFSQIAVSQNVLLNPEAVYRWNKTDKRFFLSAALGAGYLLTFQKQEGSLDLGTGQMKYESDAVHAILPSISLGLGVDPKKHLGFYFKTTYGRELGIGRENAAFLAVSTGLLIKWNRTP